MSTQIAPGGSASIGPGIAAAAWRGPGNDVDSASTSPANSPSRRGAPSTAPHQVLDPTRVEVIDGEVVPCDRQVARHRAAHGAKPDVSQTHLRLRFAYHGRFAAGA
jgi:hypothetical protein